MSDTDRKQDFVWLYFDETKVVGKAEYGATCKRRGKEMFLQPLLLD